jgi:ectoine hydroxylase-related dioxygenase (phytanoyl-CoA dioxygenase family)
MRPSQPLNRRIIQESDQRSLRMRASDLSLKRAELSSQGYTVLRSCFESEEVALLRRLSTAMSEEAGRILSESRALGTSVAERAAAQREELIVVPESHDTSKVCRFEFMYGAIPQFRTLVETLLIPYVSGLVDEGLVIFKDKTNEKTPGGGAFAPHQDFAAYRHFAPRSHITALISIDESTIANGCVHFCHGYEAVAAADRQSVEANYSGKPLFLTTQGGAQNGSIVSEVATQLHWTPVETTAADLVLLDSFVPHYSGVNNSTHSRKAMFITLSRKAEGLHYDAYYADKRRHYHDPRFHVATPTWRLADRD